MHSKVYFAAPINLLAPIPGEDMLYVDKKYTPDVVKYFPNCVQSARNLQRAFKKSLLQIKNYI